MDRRRVYLLLMGTAILLFVLAWTVVRLVSRPAAIAMTIVAAPLPPLAVIIANSGHED